MDENALKLEARLSAIEYMIAELFRITYAIAGISIEAVEREHKKFRESLRTMDMPIDDPAKSDLGAALIQEAHERLLDMIVVSMKHPRSV